MEKTEHPTEIIKSLNYEIHNLENLIKQQTNILELNKVKLENLKHRLNSLNNYIDK